MINEFLYDVPAYRCEFLIKYKPEVTKQNACTDIRLGPPLHGAKSLAWGQTDPRSNIC